MELTFVLCYNRLRFDIWEGMMKKQRRGVLLAALLVLFMLPVAAAAQEATMIYQNDFSTANALDDFETKGNWRVRDGALYAEGTSGSVYLMYTLPAAFAGQDFRVEVDFLGHTSTGGILIGGIGDSLAAAPTDFLGYDCFIGTNGKKGALGCYGATGAWGGNIHVGADTVTARDLHLSATVRGNELTYLVTSLDGKTHYYGVTYTIGTSARDVYTAFGGKVGLRKFCTDSGRFDNFRVTLLAEPELPQRTKSLALDGIALRASAGLSLQSGALTGSGAAMTDSALAADFDLACLLDADGVSRFYFGMREADGYLFRIDKPDETVSLWKIENGSYTCLGTRVCAVDGGARSVRIRVTGGVAALYFADNRTDTAPYPKLEMQLDGYAAGKFGVMLTDGTLASLSVGAAAPYDGETYTNPVVAGADPDVLYYDGTYYLYNRISAGNAVFSVSTSPDLVHWTARRTVFWHTNDAETRSYMSPNVFYHDGVFYLFYAALNKNGENRVWYATATSPYGPFLPQAAQKPLHDIAEIGGHPYRDDDGRLYMSFVRFGGGNHVWLEEVTMQDGVVTPVAGTATLAVSPTEAYENDGYGSIAEGGVLYKHNGLYYMIYASGHYKGHYGESYAVAEQILGPYTKYAYNEILPHNAAVDGVGDGIFVPSPDGKELFMVYHSHAEPGKVEPRQTCIDRVKFVPDENGGPDILTVYGPTTTAQPVPSDTARGDLDGDGKMTLHDVLLLCLSLGNGKPYSGIADIDKNGTNNIQDALKLLAQIAK